MPIMNGLEFLEIFTEKYSAIFNKTKIVILTSSFNKEEIDRAMQYPEVIDFISKPLNKEILDSISKKLLAL